MTLACLGRRSARQTHTLDLSAQEPVVRLCRERKERADKVEAERRKALDLARGARLERMKAEQCVLEEAKGQQRSILDQLSAQKEDFLEQQKQILDAKAMLAAPGTAKEAKVCTLSRYDTEARVLHERSAQPNNSRAREEETTPHRSGRRHYSTTDTPRTRVAGDGDCDGRRRRADPRGLRQGRDHERRTGQ